MCFENDVYIDLSFHVIMPWWLYVLMTLCFDDIMFWWHYVLMTLCFDDIIFWWPYALMTLCFDYTFWWHYIANDDIVLSMMTLCLAISFKYCWKYIIVKANVWYYTFFSLCFAQDPDLRNHSRSASRDTAFSIPDPWVSLQMDQQKLPQIPDKPLVQVRRKHRDKNRSSVREAWMNECDEPKLNERESLTEMSLKKMQEVYKPQPRNSRSKWRKKILTGSKSLMQQVSKALSLWWLPSKGMPDS